MLSLSSIEPQQVGVQEELLSKAIKFAIDNESQMDRDIGAALEKGCLLYTSDAADVL